MGKAAVRATHFTDSQLADAMLSIAKTPYPHDRARLASSLHMQRTRSPAPDVEPLFWRNSGITKPTLADALWPVLERKISTAIQRGRKGPPVMQACLRAYEMASAWHGLSMMLRRRRWRPRQQAPHDWIKAVAPPAAARALGSLAEHSRELRLRGPQPRQDRTGRYDEPQAAAEFWAPRPHC